MSSEWREVELQEIAEVIDSRHKTPVYSDFGLPMVRVVDVKSGEIDLSNAKLVSNDVYEDFSKGRDPEIGDLVFSRVGSYGNISYVKSKVKFCLGQNTAKIVPKNIEWRYLYYYLISPIARREIEMQVVGAVQKTISLKSIKGLPIKLPPLPEQKAIANILGKLDDKIELNRQMNQTLEDMAQALFKSWFVDFDPVIDNALLAGNPIPEPLNTKAEKRKKIQEKQGLKADDRFPNSFTYNEELGKYIPEGWEVKKLGDKIEIKRGGSPRPIKDFIVEEGYPWLKIADATAESSPFILSTREFIKEEGLKKTVYLNEGELILSNSATPGLPRILNIKACIHDGWLYFPKKDFFTDEYLYFLFLELRKLFILKGNGSVFTNLKTDILRNQMVVLPNTEVLKVFTQIAQSNLTKLKETRLQTEILTQLRDTLLPQLISGKLKVPEAMLVVEGQLSKQS